MRSHVFPRGSIVPGMRRSVNRGAGSRRRGGTQQPPITSSGLPFRSAPIRINAFASGRAPGVRPTSILADGRHGLRGRSEPVRARVLGARHARRGPGLLHPPDGRSLRELQRRDPSHAPRTSAGIPEHLRLLPMVRRPGRRGRRPRAIARAAGLVAGRAARPVRRPGPPPGDDRPARDGRAVRHPDRAVRGAHLRLRTGPVRDRVPVL